ncbi:manganese efflux pump [Clostridiisalibacter paucivorans]|uniref:manganese efflux pump n=1 Tax=Clostridiisalibacter paucivorans TaxID=408753 RepID=UPI00047C610B|nr:manganese efflux pump [Clostridiisalibacter paucivorans]
MFEILLISLAICIDSFALGITYGIKQIKIPKTAILIMNLVIIGVLGISIYLSHILKLFVSENMVSIISCIVLILLGTVLIIEGYIKYKLKNKKSNKLIKFYIPKLGLIVDIALDMTKGDSDISGDINPKEALNLGVILSIDSLGAGFGLSLGNINPVFFLVFVFFLNILSILYGIYLGSKVKKYENDLKTSLLPGSILIFVGLLKCL